MFISMVNFATARAGILGYKFEHFEKYSDGKSESIFYCLRNIVLEHQDLIRYVGRVNDALKWYFLGEFVVKSYHITVTLSNVLEATNWRDLIYYIPFMLSVVVQVFVIYYHVNELFLKSTNLGMRIYKGNWYDQTSEVTKSLLIVMSRVQRPFVLSIGNFRVIDNDLLVSMTQAAYTFVLYQMI
ncbi:unnamed protein product [Phaedon cochleariae]|uniref:Odorant receptor n=2 Tax=Phaedon cochleariae TaxID=80249 RepID=A0A9P0DL84_PHACE|nr:unnamed protein product [Phaedon cochleariae]